MSSFAIAGLIVSLIASGSAPLGLERPDTSRLPSDGANAGPTVPAGWTLVWSDEFDGAGAPDPRYWGHEVNCFGGGNNEQQCYTDRPVNSFVRDGALHIVAREERFNGPAFQDEDPRYPGPNITRNYTSARLRTRDKVDWKYGRIEVRAQLPGGPGMWPAIWMLPTDWVYGGWPSSGEIDVVEAVNLPRGDYPGWGTVIHGTLHYGLDWPQWENHGFTHVMDVNPADGFHTYSIEWEPDEIRWYVDDVHYQTQRSEGWYNYIWQGQGKGFGVANPRAPFDQRFHLLLNVAVGGDWPGPPDRNWDSDREMVVDYVRLYQCDEDRIQGSGGASCATVDPAVQVNTDRGSPGIQDYLLYEDGPQTIYGVEMATDAYAAPGATVESTVLDEGPWQVEFRRDAPFNVGEPLGQVSLAGDRSFWLAGGAGWTRNGEIEFDIKIDSIAPDTRLFVKMQSYYPQVGSVELIAGRRGQSSAARLTQAGSAPSGSAVVVPRNAWRHVAVKISDLMENRGPGEIPLDIRAIRKALILESTGPARVQINNVRLNCAYNTEPEWWQTDKYCYLALGRALDEPTPEPEPQPEPTTAPAGGRSEGAMSLRDR